ncbi:MAG TPA: MmcQ/YjbR family DNA-binding protein [Gemmatimonadota bacterium]|nr:MmcQ/YjbR family DNA-binding protein [Gemmatimonadota bacterium]
MTLDEARAVALSLPGSTEEPHFERISFRVHGKIFATAAPPGGPLHVFVDEHAVGVAVGMDPEAFEKLHWGKLVGVAVDLARAEPEIVRDLLEESWRRRATKRLIRELDERRENL